MTKKQWFLAAVGVLCIAVVLKFYGIWKWGMHYDEFIRGI